MADVTKALERMAVVPWRATLVVLAASFLVASVVSTVIGYWLLNMDAKNLSAGAARNAAAGRTQVASVSIPQAGSSLNQAAMDQIIKRNLFNSEGSTAEESAKKDDPSGPKASEIIKSDLPIKLIGTIFGGDPLSGIALVENDTKKTINSFMVGDALTKEANLKEVHKEKIIIERGGRLEYIDVTQELLTRSRRKHSKTPVAGTGEPVIAAVTTGPPPSAFKEDGFERENNKISMTKIYKDNLLSKDFTKVLQDAKATPNMENGELHGFILTRIRKDSIYEKAGLANDDIVTEINGVPLSDAAQAIKLLQSLRNEAEIEVRILRGGTPMKFELGVR